MGVVDRLKSERSIMFPFSGTLFSLYGYRIDSSSRENAFAILALGQPPNKSAMNINNLHCAAGNFDEVLLRKTAEPQGIVLERESCWSAGGDIWRRVYELVPSSPHTHEQISNSGGSFWL